ncbi:TetR family transcriptional regulator [Streptomyces malaysiensis subsp. malaysiensis]|uniref:TetR family transcriptional regulator n=1 Tax=Streptomyces malaysiensis TaxID=92644 RepID=UPI000BFDE1B3|nr:TetR family transcriptional regulator [Streptomyces malaysiensis]ATL84894.1 TetR family transcriptional regulator [Streptomyces malaysiensis]QDL71258.1 TetR family transcriptional regulator [Streptomyces malaysiensis]
MSHRCGVRQAQKEKTRRALLDAALRLLEDQSLSSLGLREVTRAVGVAPAAFYRHFRDLSDLGVALVEESLGSLHHMIGAILAGQDGDAERIDATVAAVADHVRRYPAHIRFIARERHGGVRAVREAIAAELDRFADEVATDFCPRLSAEDWPPEDVRMLAELYVDHMVMTATAFLEAQAEHLGAAGASGAADVEDAVGPAGAVGAAGAEDAADAAGAEDERRVAATARKQLLLISLGRHHWRDG